MTLENRPFKMKAKAFNRKNTIRPKGSSQQLSARWDGGAINEKPEAAFKHFVI